VLRFGGEQAESTGATSSEWHQALSVVRGGLRVRDQVLEDRVAVEPLRRERVPDVEGRRGRVVYGLKQRFVIRTPVIRESPEIHARHAPDPATG
jgi:hypothetical protein